MNSNRPYLLRAFYEWIVDNELTPYIVINADLPGVDVPRDYVENGRIVLNIAPQAVSEIELANDRVYFNARFAGTPYDIFVPMRAVGAIYAKENGRGMVFKEEDYADEPEEETGRTGRGQPAQIEGKKGKAGRPNLTVVK